MHNIYYLMTVCLSLIISIALLAYLLKDDQIETIIEDTMRYEIDKKLRPYIDDTKKLQSNF